MREVDVDFWGIKDLIENKRKYVKEVGDYFVVD